MRILLLDLLAFQCGGPTAASKNVSRRSTPSGMAIVVGTCAVIDLRLLGVGEAIPLRALHGAPRLVWTGARDDRND